MNILDFGPALERRHQDNIDRAANRAAWHASKTAELQAIFIAAALGADPAAMVPTPGLSVTHQPISALLLDEIDSFALHTLIRDAAQGRDVQIQASLLVSVLAGQFAARQADYALEEAEGELEQDGPDPDAAYERRRDDAIDFQGDA